MSLEVGHQVEALNDEDVAELTKIAQMFKNGVVIIHPEKVLFPSRYLKFAEDYFSFKSRPSDVIIAGFQKTGTTWLQEIIWNMTNDPNLDKESTDEIYLKSFFFEVDVHNECTNVCDQPTELETMQKSFPLAQFGKENFKMLDLFEHIPERRVLKTHFVPSLLNPQMMKTPQIIYIIRDPKDALVSNYYQHKMWKHCSFQGDIEEFVEAYMAGKVINGEYPNHIRQWWPYRKEENVHFIYYEDLKRNTMEEIKKLNKFLGTNLNEEQLERINHASSFQELKKKKSFLNFQEGSDLSMFNIDVIKETGGFYRKGIVGSWKEELSPELNQKFEAYARDALQGIPLPYDYLHHSSSD